MQDLEHNSVKVPVLRHGVENHHEVEIVGSHHGQLKGSHEEPIQAARVARVHRVLLQIVDVKHLLALQKAAREPDLLRPVRDEFIRHASQLVRVAPR